MRAFTFECQATSMKTYVGNACGLYTGKDDSWLRACGLWLITSYGVCVQPTRETTRSVMEHTT